MKDSKDTIEQLYGSVILKNFPNYETFWRKFIGNPNAQKPEPYKYIFPPSTDAQLKDKIQKQYEKIQITHYSLFCHFAGSHFQLKELESTENLNDPKERYFRHWEHFEVGYLHLGSVFYLLEVLWNIVIKLRSISQYKFGERFLRSKGKSGLAHRLKEAKENVRTMRDLIVHRGRAFTSFRHKGKFYIPLRVSMDMLWSQSIEVTEWLETTQKLAEDIIETEKLINDIHTFLISEYGNFIKSKNIKIDYGEKK